MVLAGSAYAQTATYWGSPTTGGFGDVTFAAPLLIKCRWEDRNEVFTDPTGQDQTSRSIVWTFSKLEVGGYLCRGDHVTVVVTDPTTLQDALEIQRSDETPDLRGLNMERKAFL